MAVDTFGQSGSLIDVTPKQKAVRDRLERILKGLQTVTNRSFAQIEREAAVLLKSLDRPFSFVVMGEVNTGKSSALNALLGQKLCADAPGPETNRINEITYSTKPFHRVRDEVVEIGAPIPLLEGIMIVDTPGTNSKYQSHEEQTRRYVSESDLVLFAFFAKNPHPKTGIEFLKEIHSQGIANIAFLLLQADWAKENEKRVSKDTILQEAHSLGIQNPQIFLLSADNEVAKPGSGGFEELRIYIKNHVTGTRAYNEKLNSMCKKTKNALTLFWKYLIEGRKSLEQRLEQKKKLDKYLSALKDSATDDIERFLKELDTAYRFESDKLLKQFPDRHGFWGPREWMRNPPREEEIRRFCSQQSW